MRANVQCGSRVERRAHGLRELLRRLLFFECWDYVHRMPRGGDVELGPHGLRGLRPRLRFGRGRHVHAVRRGPVLSNSAHKRSAWNAPGTYSNPDQATCTHCGDAGYANYDQTLWDQAQTNLASEDECKCKTGRTGANCDQEVCATTTPVVSLGFLLLEVQWPRHARRLSRNEAFSGISAAFRAFDANGDNRLSLGEARAGIADGLMGVPLSVSHIWSRGDKKLYDSDVTIAEMIQDELGRLDTQQTRELYEQPSGSGEITTMEATYPNPLTENTKGDRSCKDQNGLPPILEWTVDRGDKIIFQQCAFLNGEALSGADGLDNEVSDGKKR